MQPSQGKVREKSGNFDILCEWQPWVKASADRKQLSSERAATKSEQLVYTMMRLPVLSECPLYKLHCSCYATRACCLPTFSLKRPINIQSCFLINVWLEIHTWRVHNVTGWMVSRFIWQWQIDHEMDCQMEMVGWLVVFNVPSTARSFRDGTPIYCPLWRTCSSINTPFRPGIEPRAVAWQSITLPLRRWR